MKSMTGYGKANFSDAEFDIEIEIRSVNHRFFDVKYIYPRELSFLESKLSDLIRQKLKRGKIELRINFKDKRIPILELNEVKLKIYWELFQKAKELMNAESELPLFKILEENDIITTKSYDLSNLKFTEIVLNTLSLSIKEHQKMASKEGRAMRKYLVSSLKTIEDSLSRIKTEFPNYKEKINSDLKIKIAEIISHKLRDEDYKRIILEAAIYTDKSDVNEEIIRLYDHVEKIKEFLAEKKTGGKKLNFIIQEMHREINTLGSKFNSIKIFNDVIVIKEEIEKCRELVQNVE
ncbi:MAG: YicC family protein [Candidatus Cloacimonetes bacterium]|nr:YicC family protein [Candidatus Cloacimonadota bacterium]